MTGLATVHLPGPVPTGANLIPEESGTSYTLSEVTEIAGWFTGTVFAMSVIVFTRMASEYVQIIYFRKRLFFHCVSLFNTAALAVGGGGGIVVWLGSLGSDGSINVYEADNCPK
jgi:hypothetical protein